MVENASNPVIICFNGKRKISIAFVMLKAHIITIKAKYFPERDTNEFKMGGKNVELSVRRKMKSHKGLGSIII